MSYQTNGSKRMDQLLNVCNTLKQGYLSKALVFLLSFFVVTAQAEVTVTYYHTDALGSVVATTDDTGQLLWSESYHPYGERYEKSESTDQESHFYTGKPHDDDTGLSYFGARYYHPQVGRFMGIDPVSPLQAVERNVQMFNRYAYAGNNPYRFIDPDGREFIDYYAQGQAILNPDPVAVDALTKALGVAALGVSVVGLEMALAARLGKGAADTMIFSGGLSASGGDLPISGGGKVTKDRIKVTDVTSSGSRKPNFEIDKTRSEFENHLTNNGFTKSTVDSKKGLINIFSKNGKKEFTTRGFSTSTDGPSGELFINGKVEAKIRFQNE